MSDEAQHGANFGMDSRSGGGAGPSTISGAPHDSLMSRAGVSVDHAERFMPFRGAPSP